MYKNEMQINMYCIVLYCIVLLHEKRGFGYQNF